MMANEAVYADRAGWRPPMAWWSSSWGLSIIGLVLSLGVWKVVGYRFPVPEALTGQFDFIAAINNGELWLKDHVRDTTRAIAKWVNLFISSLELFLWLKPWPLLVIAVGMLGLRYGGLRLGLFTAFGVMYWGIVDMWDPAMSTLSLVLVSVAISIIIGIPLGIWSSQSDRFETILRPVLDTMQTMPAFVYLLPAIFLFGAGQTGAAMAIIIYAIPPVVRLTNLGIRQVPANQVEVSRSFGATGAQTMLKVQIPTAMPSIILGVNQTMMMALGLAVLAVFIGTDGLEREVYRALTRLRVGWSFEAGMGIVFMAIIFDRLTLAMSRQGGEEIADRTRLTFRLFPQSWDRLPPFFWIETGIDRVWRGTTRLGWLITEFSARLLERALRPVGETLAERAALSLREAGFLFVSVLVLLAIYLFDLVIADIGYFPEYLQVSIREPIDHAVNLLVSNPNFGAFSQWLRGAIFNWQLNPLNQFLVGLPWFYVLAVLFLMAWRANGPVFAAVVTALMFFMALAGIWEITMETLAATLVSVLICFVLGVPLGVLAAQSRIAEQIIRPILDFMQTMPAFVYLIPAIMLFGGSRSTAIIATVIYALPPIVRLTSLGLRQVPAQVGEVVESFGATRLQQLAAVRLPMASPAIILGINQCIVMALAMQAITPMIGGTGLGRQVFAGMTTANTGMGLVAGIGIALLAIILDRLTNAWTAKQREALGL